jgi:nicotinate-nucleotide--dimethylbenzimidazole phosphoribosyltransferase
MTGEERLFREFSDKCRARITGPDEEIRRASIKRWDSLCKPIGGMGIFEELIARIGAIQGTVHPRLDAAAVVIMGADNGVTAEGVSQCGSEVTARVLNNIAEGRSSVCVMSAFQNGNFPEGRTGLARTDIIPVNIGMNTDASHPAVWNRPVRHGSGNIAKGPAMTGSEAVQAVTEGIRTASRLRESGYDLLAAGEMGIGNTTSSAALVSALFHRDPEQTAGYGAGLSEEGLRRKKDVIREALRVNGLDGEGTECVPLLTLSRVGGLDIAGMCGLFLGAAICRMPVLIDGFISAAAAFLAYRIAPECKSYMIATHCSSEPGCGMLLEKLGLHAPLHADMHLGEGTGAAMFLPLLRQALSVYENLPDFEEGRVKAYRRFH